MNPASDVGLIPLTHNDLDLIYKLYSHPETASLANINVFKNFQQASEFLNRLLRSPNVFSYLILKGGRKSGSITVSRLQLFHEPALEIGYALVLEARNQGVMSRALDLIIDMVINDPDFKDIRYIYAKFFERNIKSARLLYRHGFTFVDRELGYNIFHKLEVTDIVALKINR